MTWDERMTTHQMRIHRHSLTASSTAEAYRSPDAPVVMVVVEEVVVEG